MSRYLLRLAALTATTLMIAASSRAADARSSCYSASAPGATRSLSDNRDRLIADLARRKGTDSCALWSSLNKAERYIFLMNTAYLGDQSSRLYPPESGRLETALDHASALYSINGPRAGQGVDGSGRGGEDYNRIYLGFDTLAACVMRDPVQANPRHLPGFNRWRPSDDGSGPHAPFNAREMIFWDSWIKEEKLNSLGPQFHHFKSDADVDAQGIDKRLGVCGVTDPTLAELTVAFDFYHNSDPLGDYAGRGGYGWEIVGKHVAQDPAWGYAPRGCSPTPPVNDDPYGGGTYNGMGPSLAGEVCVSRAPASAQAAGKPGRVAEPRLLRLAENAASLW